MSYEQHTDQAIKFLDVAARLYESLQHLHVVDMPEKDELLALIMKLTKRIESRLS